MASGSTWRSLRSSTNDAAATVRSRSGAISSGAGPGGAGTGSAGAAVAGDAPFPAKLSAPTRRASSSSRTSLSSSSSSLTWPSATALASSSPQGPSGPGIDRSSVATAVGTVLRAACQSDVTTPSKPHSSLSTSRSSRAFSVIRSPLTLL